MPTIKARKQANGTTRYSAFIRIRRQGQVIHQECKTFALRTAALSWAKHREIELEHPGAFLDAQEEGYTLAELIRWYIDNFETISQWQRSKQTHLAA